MVVHVTVQVEDEDGTREAADSLIEAFERGFVPDARGVEPAKGGPAPDGARSGELAVLGGLIVTTLSQPESVGAVLRYIADRIGRRQGSVEIDIDGRKLLIENATKEQVETLIDAYLRKVFDQDS